MDENKINLILSTLRIAIIALGVILMGIIVSSSVADESYVEGEANYGGFLDWMFYIIYTVGIATAVAALGFGIYTFVMKLINDVKSQVGTLTGMSVFLLIGLLSYFAFAVTESESVFAGGSMIYVYLLGIVAVASIVWAEVSSIFK